jgi:hypothetical protein
MVPDLLKCAVLSKYLLSNGVTRLNEAHLVPISYISIQAQENLATLSESFHSFSNTALHFPKFTLPQSKQDQDEVDAMQSNIPLLSSDRLSKIFTRDNEKDEMETRLRQGEQEEQPRPQPRDTGRSYMRKSNEQADILLGYGN